MTVGGGRRASAARHELIVDGRVDRIQRDAAVHLLLDLAFDEQRLVVITTSATENDEVVVAMDIVGHAKTWLELVPPGVPVTSRRNEIVRVNPTRLPARICA